MVKDSHISYLFRSDRDTSDLTSHAQDVEVFSRRTSQATFNPVQARLFYRIKVQAGL